MADGSLPIVVTPEAFGRAAFDLTVVEGLTVRAMLVEAVKAGLPVEALNRTEIYVDGARLDRETALDHVLAADQVVNVVVEPMGGGGGGRKDIGQILLTVAVIAVSAWVGGGAGGLITKEIWARAAAAAITLGGQALIASLYAPDSKTTKANDRYALQSASNQYRQWGSMPLALGEVVVAPDLAAKTFTQSQGDDVWMYGVLGVHYGPCEVSEVKIGDTLVSTMGPGDFRMVQHLEPGPRTFQLYPNDVDQLDLNEELKATPSSATPLIRAASSDGSRFDLDFFLPAGLYFQKDDGRVLTAHASVAVRYRPIDQTGVATGPWQSAPSWARTSATKDPIRVTHSVHLPHGRYEFELTRNRPDDGNDKRRDTIMVSAIKSVAFRKPITDETLSIIEFAVRATAINQGGLAPITCRIKPKCSTWTGGAWGPPVATSNPAALARWLLTGPAPAKPLLPAQADARLRVWHQLCEQYDWKCHLYLTEARTQSEALAILERAGRAGVFWDGTQLAASPWVEKPIPAQVFTDDNLKDHRWEIVYPDPVHALRVEFQNIEKGGEPDELFVYNDGYGEVADPANGIKAASLIEALTLDGQTTPNRAYRDGRWKLGQRRHQRRIDTWTADVEHLISQYGSRVRLAWNRAGGGSARVRCRRWSEDGSAVVGLRLSAPVEMFAGVSYAVDLRTKGGLYDGVPIQTQPGVTREILFASARAPSVCPAAGDLIAFGEVEKVSEDVEIIAIEPGENLTAVLTGVRYVAPLLMAGETGPIPPLSSKLSGDRQANPPRPTLLGVTADAHAVRVSFDMPTWRGAPLSGFSVRWRAKGEEGEAGSWAPLPALDAAARELIAPPLREAPVEGVDATRVEIEITAATVDGRVSRPLEVTVVKPVPGAPLASVWSVESKGPDANGVSQPILIVRGEITDPNVAAVRIAWGLTVDGPWTEVYEGAPLTKALEIGNLTPGVEHFVAITHLSAQSVPSQFLVIGPRVPGQLISGGATHLKGEPVQDILDKLTDTADLADRNRQAVADLEEVYGDTASAAASAAAAALERASAEAAAALSANKAEDAAASAVAASTAAGDALGSASASAASASVASTKADEASISAAASTAAKTAAETARGQAQTAATQAASSRDDAAGSAANASASATQSANSKDAAAGSASAAAGSASTAATKAGEAGTHAAAALASQVTASTAASSAQGVANRVVPERLSVGADFTNVSNGAPDTIAPMTVGTVVTVAGVGDVRQFTTNTVVRTRGAKAISAGRIYQVTARTRTVVDAAGNILRSGFQIYDAAWTSLGQYVPTDDANATAAKGWQTFSKQRSAEQILALWPTAAHVRGFLQGGHTAGGSASGATWQGDFLRLEDVTESARAAISADASATSASSASASETAAGQFANSASGSAVTAATKAGDASSFASQAAGSASDAAGSAVTASQASGTSVSARDAAIGARNDAQAAAATSVAQSSAATAAAAEAKLSANLAASVGAVRPNLLKNGGLEDGSVGMSGSGPLVVSDDPAWGRNIKNAAITSGTRSIIWPAIPVRGGARYTISGDTGYFHTGTGGNSYLDLIFYDANGTQVLDGPQKAINGPHDFSNAKERLQAHAVSVVAPANAVTATARAIFTDMNAPTFMGARRVKVEEGDLPATAFTSEASANQIAAQLNITAAVAADAADRVGSVRFDVTGGADGDPFQIWGRAGPDGSVAGMVASELSFSTVVRGLVVKAMRLIGGDVFVINRLYVGPNKEIEIEPFTPAINWTMGSARLAIGKLANDNLLFWFGPNVTAANMRKSNAALWLDRAGGAYFGGALSAGTLTSKAATTSLSFGATTETARFNSNGGSITVTLSLSGGWSKGYWNPSSLPAATENGNVVVTLYRSVNGGAFSPVVTLPMTYNWSRETREYEPGLGWHIVEQGAYAGSLTYTDPQTSTQDRQYRATITTFSPVTQTGIMTSQNLSIIAVE
ncbi:TipJ family phage tail tip protein [Brevundimonas diminuta]|uniref:TipJ family phage tail tip protein n=1 Tax=Brevundimonas diminuta TaxID=293 RepID=UPI003D9A6FB4